MARERRKAESDPKFQINRLFIRIAVYCDAERMTATAFSVMLRCAATNASVLGNRNMLVYKVCGAMALGDHDALAVCDKIRIP